MRLERACYAQAKSSARALPVTGLVGSMADRIPPPRYAELASLTTGVRGGMEVAAHDRATASRYAPQLCKRLRQRAEMPDRKGADGEIGPLVRHRQCRDRSPNQQHLGSARCRAA